MPLGSIAEWRARIGSSWCALGQPFKTRSPFRHARAGRLQTPLTLNQVVTMMMTLIIFTAINLTIRIVWTTSHYRAYLGLFATWMLHSLEITGLLLFQSLHCIITSDTLPWILVLCCTDSRPNQPVNSKQKSWSNLLQLACLLMTLLETIQTVASSVIFYQILKSGDVEQNPGPDIDYDSVDSGRILDEEDLFDVLEEISTLESRYYQIGIGLRLKPKDVQSIDKEDPSRALSTVIETWLQQKYNVQRHGPPTWQMLAKVVNSPAGGNDHTLAKKIALNHPAVQEKNQCEAKSSTASMQEEVKQKIHEASDANLLNNNNIKEVLDEMWNYRARWKFIGVELGIDMGTLDAIEKDCKVVDECLLKMINIWLRNSSRPTQEVIRVALQSKHVSDAAAVADDRKSEVTNDKLKIYTTYLKSLYKAKTQASSTDDDHWPPPVTNKVFSLAMIKPEKVQRRNIDDHFVLETITGKVDDILQRKVPITLEQIFDKGEQKKTLIEGAPGCGKSTLSLHICHEWIAGRLLKEYSQVILVKLREKAVQNAKSIADLLPKRDDTMGQNAEKEITTRDGEGVLFIFDGWDELPEKAPGRSIIRDILDRKKLHKSSVIITSRPISSMNLHKLVDTRIEILGFTKAELQKYFTECLGDDLGKVKELEQRIKENPVVEGSCYLPLNASILVHLFKCDGVLPNTQFGIFSKLICNCIFRHLKKRNEQLDIPGIKSLDKLPPSIQNPFERICEIAYKGVIEDHITFDLECSFNTLGLLQGVESFASGMPSHSYNFLHLSIQELLAAIHMSTKLEPSEQLAQFQELFGRARFSAVFQFYAAKTKLKTRGMDKIVIQVVQKCTQDESATELTPHSPTDSDQNSGSSSLGHKPQPLLLSLLHCLFEAQDETLCQLVAEELKGELRGLEDISLSPADCLSVGYFLTHCSQFKVYLGECFIDVDGCKALFRKGQNYDLQYLDLMGNSIGDEGAKVLSDAIKTMGNLQGLDLGGNSIGDEGTKVLSDTIKTMGNLQELYLNNNSIGAEGAKVLSDAIKTMGNLQELYLGYNSIGDEGAKVLSDAIKTMGNLQRLDLEGNSIGDEGAKVLSDAIKTMDNLQRLVLNVNSIGDEGAKALSDAIKTMDNLQVLVLHDNSIGDEGAKALSDAIKTMGNLLRLDLGVNSIGDEGAKVLSDAIKTMGNLRMLHIGGNAIGDVGREALREAAKEKGTEIIF